MIPRDMSERASDEPAAYDLEQQMIELQSKLAYQEDTVQTLNDVVSKQQVDILQLKSQMGQVVGELRAILSDLGEDGESSAQQRPPHY